MYNGQDLSGRLTQTQEKIFEDIHDKLINLGYVCKRGRYYYSDKAKDKNKEKIIMRFEKDRGKDRGFVITIRLPNLAAYSCNISKLSERVRECILNGQNCRPCYGKYCGKGYVFNFQDKSYLKCHMLCDNFKFYGLGEEDINSLEKLIEYEHSYFKKPNIVV